jgi:hypothetical protein
MTNLSSFDLDFSYGVDGEGLVSDLILGKRTVEVKRDRRWKETGNLYIETRCFYQRSQAWEPSGLSVTEAGYWAFVIEESILLIPTEILKSAVGNYGKQIRCSIPPNESEGYLITPEQLLQAQKEYHNATQPQ